MENLVPEHAPDELPIQPSSQSELLHEFLSTQRDSLSELIQAFARSKARAPRFSLLNTRIAYSAVLAIVAALSLSAWHGRIGSDVLSFAFGLIVGLIAYHMKAIFPLKG